MRAEFHLHREQTNKLTCKKITQPTASYHFHSQIELLLIHSGEVEIWINERREILRSGDLSVALSFDPHSYCTLSPTQATCLIIPIDLCQAFADGARNKRLPSPFIRNQALFEELNRYCEEFLCGSNEIKRQGSIYMVLGALLEQMQPETEREAADPAPATRILFYINENFQKPLTLSTIASELGYNASYLSRCFKDFFHIGINRYITLMRLRKAVLLMRQKKNIATCAFESGFNSIRTFYRAFYEEFQCTPKEYINKEKKHENI